MCNPRNTIANAICNCGATAERRTERKEEEEERRIHPFAERKAGQGSHSSIALAAAAVAVANVPPSAWPPTHNVR